MAVADGRADGRVDDQGEPGAGARAGAAPAHEPDVEAGTAPQSSVQWLAAWSRAEGSTRVRTAFEEWFGGAPAGVWSAPGRINLIGEHVDYNGGLCMPMALAHRTYVALTPRADRLVRLFSAQESGSEPWTVALDDVDVVGSPGAVNGWGAYVSGVAWALERAGFEVRGFDAVVDSCVPYGAGLSSSAALEAAFAVALDDVFDLGLGASDAGRARLVEACIRAENEIAGAPTGGMDQSASLRCATEHALLLDTRSGQTRQIPFDTSHADPALAMLVIDTRAPHELVDGQYAARRGACERAAAILDVASLREVPVGGLDAALRRLSDPSASGPDGEVLQRRVRHVVTEIARVEEVAALLDHGRLAEVGPVLSAAHTSLRDDYEVSCSELDTAVG